MKKILILMLTILLAFSVISCNGLDKSGLESVIAKAEKYNDQTLYTEETFKVFTEKLEAAKSVLEDTETTEGKIRTAISELNSAINSLDKIADFSVLEKLLTASYLSSAYTKESYEAYLEACERANEVYANKNSRQSAVNSAVNLLKSKIDALVPVADTTELERLLAIEVIEEKYTTTSFRNYNELRDVALLLIEKAEKAVTGDDVAECIADITMCVSQFGKVINDLVPRGDTSMLSAELERAKKIYAAKVGGVVPAVYYSKESYNALSEKMLISEQALLSTELSDEQLLAITSDLVTAIESLVVSPEFSYLYDLIKKAQTDYLSHPDYFTVETFDRLNSVLNTAIDTLYSPGLNIDTLMQQTKNVEDAIEGLNYKIIIGTGDTSFDLKDISILIGEYETTANEFFYDQALLVAYLSDPENVNVSLVEGDATMGYKITLADGCELYISSTELRIKAVSTDLSNVEHIKAIVSFIDFSSDTSAIIEAMGKNPTEYGYDPTLGTYEFKYRDEVNKITLTLYTDNATVKEIILSTDSPWLPPVVDEDHAPMD